MLQSWAPFVRCSTHCMQFTFMVWRRPTNSMSVFASGTRVTLYLMVHSDGTKHGAGCLKGFTQIRHTNPKLWLQIEARVVLPCLSFVLGQNKNLALTQCVSSSPITLRCPQVSSQLTAGIVSPCAPHSLKTKTDRIELLLCCLPKYSATSIIRTSLNQAKTFG